MRDGPITEILKDALPAKRALFGDVTDPQKCPVTHTE